MQVFVYNEITLDEALTRLNIYHIRLWLNKYLHARSSFSLKNSSNAHRKKVRRRDLMAGTSPQVSVLLSEGRAPAEAYWKLVPAAGGCDCG